jgi:hypothetical protein
MHAAKALRFYRRLGAPRIGGWPASACNASQLPFPSHFGPLCQVHSDTVFQLVTLHASPMSRQQLRTAGFLLAVLFTGIGGTILYQKTTDFLASFHEAKQAITRLQAQVAALQPPRYAATPPEAGRPVFPLPRPEREAASIARPVLHRPAASTPLAAASEAPPAEGPAPPGDGKFTVWVEPKDKANGPSTTFHLLGKQ